MGKMKVKTAIRLLTDNGFELLHRKGSHMKYGKGILRAVITEGGHRGSGELHSKQEKELLRVISGEDNIKHIEQLENEKNKNRNL